MASEEMQWKAGSARWKEIRTRILREVSTQRCRMLSFIKSNDKNCNKMIWLAQQSIAKSQWNWGYIRLMRENRLQLVYEVVDRVATKSHVGRSNFKVL